MNLNVIYSKRDANGDNYIKQIKPVSERQTLHYFSHLWVLDFIRFIKSYIYICPKSGAKTAWENRWDYWDVGEVRKGRIKEYWGGKYVSKYIIYLYENDFIMQLTIIITAIIIIIRILGSKMKNEVKPEFVHLEPPSQKNHLFHL